MAQISVTINNRKYEIACDDGQEAHLTRLAQYVDKRVDELVAAVGQVGDARLLVMVSLLVADELSEVYTELDQSRNDRRPGNAPAAAPPAFTATEIEALAERIEKIAESLE